jgi:hypothetical protein
MLVMVFVVVRSAMVYFIGDRSRGCGKALMLVMVFVMVRSAMVFFIGDLVVEGLMHVWVLGNLGEHSRNPFHYVKIKIISWLLIQTLAMSLYKHWLFSFARRILCFWLKWMFEQVSINISSMFNHVLGIISL